MDSIGNLIILEEKIAEKYQKQISEIELNTQKEVNAIHETAEEKIGIILEQAKTDAIEAAQEAKQRVFNEQKLKAKKDFEFAREKLIESVFLEVSKQAQKTSLSKEYLQFAKKNALKGPKVVVFGGSTKYKKVFPKMVLDSSIIGLKFESENLIFDLSINGALESRQEIIRRIVVEELFGEK